MYRHDVDTVAQEKQRGALLEEATGRFVCEFKHTFMKIIDTEEMNWKKRKTAPRRGLRVPTELT